MTEAATTVAISVLAKIAEYSVKPVLRQLRPIFCFQSIVNDFKSARIKLKDIQETVQSDVRQATNNARVTLDNVAKWSEDVKKVMEAADELEKKLEANSCSWCPNLTWNCKFSRLVLEKTNAMKRLCDDGNFQSVAHPAPPLHQHIVGSSSSKAFIHSQSSKSAFDQIKEALEKDDVNIIGLYGEAGMGKTALAKQVGEEARKQFYRVILVSVSKHPHVTSMQDFIAEFLELPIGHLKIDQARAAKLQQRLQNGEKILIILDDVRKEFNLEAVIGIPSCKILLTAHSRSHVPDGLQTQSDVQLAILPEHEAWALFQSIAGVGDQVRAHDGAKNVIAECKGRPKALVMLGRVVKGKSPDEWDEAREQARVSKLKVTQDLEEQAKNLSLKRERVETDIKKAKDDAEEIHKDVDNWLIDVDKVMKDKEQFMNELHQSRYLFDEHDDKTKAEELTVNLNKLWAKGDFSKVSYSSPLHQLSGSTDFMPSQSAISAFNQILGALQKDDVNIIGLYGMGGIGKTTLATQVQKEVEGLKIFDHAIMVNVSQTPDVSDMQKTIGDFLKLEFKQESKDGRASKLNQVFKSKKILLILDDIWKQFDLTTIGITLDECKGCKILFTTRVKNVFDSKICQTNIQLNFLSEDEAREFFMKKACVSEEEELKLNKLTEEIVAECKGLPIALAAVGAALRNKGEDEWREAQDHLRNSRLLDIVGVDSDDEKNAYKCLRLSYDYLKHSEQAQGQLILLLCSLYPEDYVIEVEALSRYVFGMRLFNRVESIEDARRKVRVTIRFLKESCLLLDVVDKDVVREDVVKMHDVVRDAMLWIGGTEAREKNVLTVKNESDLKEFIRNNSFENCRAVSFMPESVPILSRYNQLECPNLETILIFGGVVELSNEFFQHMTFLKVLDLKTPSTWNDNCRFGMPHSLYNLTDLRALMLEGCVCSNCSILGEVRNLEILSLEESKIDCGVEIVSGLKELRLLDLSGTEAEREYPSDMIEALSKLEELHGHVIRKCEVGEGRSSSIEWKLPSNLVALSMGIEDATCIPMGFCFPNLATYFICVGTLSTLFWSSASIMRCLELKGIEDESAMINICKELLPTVLDLRLHEWKDLCSLAVFYSHAEGLFQRLERLEIWECYKMERVFEFEEDENINTNLRQLHFLKTLTLLGLLQLKHVWKGPTRSVSLSNLTEIDISWCSKLTCVFPSPLLATTLQQLERLTIARCDDLEEIVSRRGDSDGDDLDNIQGVKTADGKEEPVICFQKLTTLHVSRCGKLKTIFPISAAFPKLETLELEHNAELEHVLFGQLDWDCTWPYPLLEHLTLVGCPKLCTQFVAASMKYLSTAKAKTITLGDIQGVEDVMQIERSHLENMSLQNLQDLKCIWRGPTQSVCFVNLYRLEVIGCNRLTQISDTTIATTLPKLKMLIIGRCNELEQVFVMAENGNELIAGVVIENLTTLDVSECGKLKTISPIIIVLPKLETLRIKRNAELEHVFGQSGKDCTGKYPFLEDLHLVGCPKMCAQFAVSCIQNLSTAKHLRKIKLGYIRGVEELIQFENQNVSPADDDVQLDDGEDADSDLPFSCLETLSLRDMAELKCICHGPTQNICFINLREIEVIGCNKLKHIFAVAIARNLSNLKKLIVQRCNELEQVITVDDDNDDADDGKEEWENDSKAGIITKVGFENLEVLHVSNCEKLKTIFSMFIHLPKLDCLGLESNAQLEGLFGQSDCVWTSNSTCLKTLSVTSCPKLCKQFVAMILSQLQPQSASQAKNVTLGDIKAVEDVMQIERSHLEKLSLQNLQDLRCMWRGPTQNICFVNLYRLEVIGCNGLKHLSDTTIATTLPKLTELIVGRCNELEKVIVMAENGNELIAGVVFENLRTLDVSECGKLKTIFPMSILLPKLGRLRIYRNAELENVFGQSDKDCTWKYPFLIDLCFVGCPKLCSQFAVFCKQNLSTTKHIRKIELGYIHGVEELIQLQSQNVNRDDDDNQFDDSEDADGDLPFSCLETLSLRNVAELKCIWHGPTQNICFANLSELKVIGCNRLKHVFTTAMARKLPNLKKLIVRRCNELEQVITVDGDGKEEWENNAKGEIMAKVGLESLEVLYVSNCEKLKTIFSIFIPLPKLNCLRLESNAHLESLSGQSDSVYTSSSVHLKVLSVTSCPKLCKQFVAVIKSQLQVQTTSQPWSIINLSSFQEVEELVQSQRQDDGSVDETMRLERHYLKLEEVGDLKRIWSGPTQNTSFSVLYTLRVIGCSRLKQLFTTSMATSLHHLELLSVERCHDLQQIIEEEGNEENNTQSVQQLDFSNLHILRLIDLPNLVRFCPISCSLLLPLLAKKNLKVEGCPKSTIEFFSQQSYKQDSEVKYLFQFDDGKDEDDDSDDYYYSSPKSFQKLLGYRVVEEV